MTTFLLIRHATNDWVGKSLAGDTRDVHLNAEGREQAVRLAERLRGVRIDRICSSPLERAMETAEPLASERRLEVHARTRLTEIGLGQWNGREIAGLEDDALWRRFNAFRSSTRPPGGELMTEVQSRLADEMEELRQSHADGAIALFSHADVIKCAVAFYAGIPIDLMHRLEIGPASVTVITLAESGARLLTVNDTGMFGC
jgi:probable phosphomutase (TIGR03848 family)